ncbi:DUF543-domain-containing protein [Basidiobolus meristosporus CBS 931.73]|uniref:MICOS complex subunit MIC10 n=1 Tax=Basidiobolus meristosporus CBS 931.73 TaxID=1314790 RepID=A0A1Y1ZCZ5_9FUNG|nr:DUF543-domain-containing protein [Basidiobolus meristosporus CBS 931.73]|eukprot:ORY08131.1 DUF543-domain-containing protein [Basidiobolus meristosporus CBS 931.73]
MSEQPKQVPSEELLAQKWDRTVSNFIVKTGVGLSTGIVASVLFFKRRAWPVTLFTGFSMGMAYAESQRLFNATSGMNVQVKKAVTNQQ